MSSPKEFHIDAVYPEPLSRLRRGHIITPGDSSPASSSYRRAVKKQRHGGAAGAGRFRTQPVTFQEIKEVDEDNIVELENTETLRRSIGTFASCSSSFKSETDLNLKFQLFYQSIKPGGNDEDQGNLLGSPTTSPLGILEAKDKLDPPPQNINNNLNNSSGDNNNFSHPPTSSPPISIGFSGSRSRQSF